MKTKTKRIWLALTLVTAFAVAAGLLWRNEPPQIITLPNGNQYRFAGVTYGTNHVQGPTLARLVQRLPVRLANLARRALGARAGQISPYRTAEPSLCLWLEPLTTNTASTASTIYGLLADESGVLSGERPWPLSWFGFDTRPWLVLHYRILPRRSRILKCVVFEYRANETNGDYRELGNVRFPNPLVGEYPQWQAESLPATRPTGDVQVRLERFTTGLSPYPVVGSFDGDRNMDGGRPAGFLPARPGDEVLAGFDLIFLPQTRADQLWTVQSAELTDATGNRVRNGAPRNIRQHFAVGPALWPDEAAWKVKLEIKRTRGFAPDEIVRFAGVQIPPPGQTNTLSLTQTSGGLEITLKQFARRPNAQSAAWGSFETYTKLEHTKIREGITLDFLEIAASDGRKLDLGWRTWSDHSCEFFMYPLPSGVESVDITFVVQRTRTVEFLVKPLKAE